MQVKFSKWQRERAGEIAKARREGEPLQFRY